MLLRGCRWRWERRRGTESCRLGFPQGRVASLYGRCCRSFPSPLFPVSGLCSSASHSWCGKANASRILRGSALPFQGGRASDGCEMAIAFSRELSCGIQPSDSRCPSFWKRACTIPTRHELYVSLVRSTRLVQTKPSLRVGHFEHDRYTRVTSIVLFVADWESRSSSSGGRMRVRVRRV